ncbi:MAG: GNAT family N-acetyltransferase [Candidatus Heimdallarchaeota archaeon]|nr:GNAT family N-acetyltransferase [Candidatus Heimdallarchaeota archaeon]
MVTIRSMDLEDTVEVYKLGKVAFIDENKDKESFAYSYWSLSAVVNFVENYIDLTFVAEDNDEIVGFVLGHPTYEKMELGYLEWVAVKSTHRKLGVAIKLIDAIQQAFVARGLNSIVTDIKQDNIASLSLFEKKFGFKVIESINFLKKDLS